LRPGNRDIPTKAHTRPSYGEGIWPQSATFWQKATSNRTGRKLIKDGVFAATNVPPHQTEKGLPKMDKRVPAEQTARQTVSTVNGRAIRRVFSERFGDLFAVDGIKRAFSTRAAAEAFAKRTPSRPAEW